MNTLRCDVGNCATNRDGYCCREAIQVEGDSARDSVETCCSSFREEIFGLSNDVIDQSPNPRCDVLCDAGRCLYNANGVCATDVVDIRGYGAENSGDTNCQTFRSR